MSVEAIAWALNDAAIPAERRDASSLAIVLVGLANHADPQGCNAFPAVATLVRCTRLSPRSVQYALRGLVDLGLITPSDPNIVAAHLKRPDRRPNGWDLAIHRVVHSSEVGVHTLHPASARGVQARPDGVQTTTSRGASTAPEPSLNRPRNRPAPREPARRVTVRSATEVESRPVGPPCGQCDARDTDPITARVIWLDADHTDSARCPRCHPHANARLVMKNPTMTNTPSRLSLRHQRPAPDSREAPCPRRTGSGQTGIKCSCGCIGQRRQHRCRDKRGGAQLTPIEMNPPVDTQLIDQIRKLIEVAQERGDPRPVGQHW